MADMTLKELRDQIASLEGEDSRRKVWVAVLDAHLAGMGEPVAWRADWPDWRQYHDRDESPLPESWESPPPKITPLYLSPPASADVASLQSRLAEQDAEIARLTEYVRDADRRVGAQFMAAQTAAEESLRRLNACGVAHRAKRAAESRLAAANALLREAVEWNWLEDGWPAEMEALDERIAAHLSENTHG